MGKKIILFTLIFNIICSFAFGGKKIIIVTGEYAPYTSEKLEGYGLASEVSSAAFNEMGYTVEIKFYPWKRCELLVQRGEADAVIPYAKTEEREKIYVYSQPIGFSKNKFFYSKKKFKKEIVYENLEDLSPYKIGGGVGYFYIPMFEKAGLNTEYIVSESGNMKKLNVGRIDFYILDELVGLNIIKELFPKNTNDFGTLKKSYDESGMYLLFSKKNPKADKLAVEFNKGLEKIKEKGIYKKIIAKYGLSE